MVTSLTHLLPFVQAMALLPIEQRIAKLHCDYWIGYNLAEKALNRLEELLQSPKRIRIPNMLIIGPTNNDKTMIVEKFRRKYLPYKSNDEEHEVIPALMIQMPSDPSRPSVTVGRL